MPVPSEETFVSRRIKEIYRTYRMGRLQAYRDFPGRSPLQRAARILQLGKILKEALHSEYSMPDPQDFSCDSAEKRLLRIGLLIKERRHRQNIKKVLRRS